MAGKTRHSIDLVSADRSPTRPQEALTGNDLGFGKVLTLGSISVLVGARHLADTDEERLVLPVITFMIDPDRPTSLGADASFERIRRIGQNHHRDVSIKPTWWAAFTEKREPEWQAR